MNTIQLIPEQQRVLDANGPVRAIDPRDNSAYVLVPEREFEKMKSDSSSGGVLTSAEMLDRVMADDDANDPTLEFYQRKYLP